MIAVIADGTRRDDLTVEVIFFGDGAENPSITGTDKVMVNEEATANIKDDPKPKL